MNTAPQTASEMGSIFRNKSRKTAVQTLKSKHYKTLLKKNGEWIIINLFNIHELKGLIYFMGMFYKLIYKCDAIIQVCLYYKQIILAYACWRVNLNLHLTLHKMDKSKP